MKKLPYDELLRLYNESQQTIIDLSETLERREWDIILLKNSIDELVEILYANGIFMHFDFD